MTKYQRKRQILNKINARTRSMAKKYGIDRATIAEKAIDGLDGVFIDYDYGTINITKGFESEELYKILEKNVLTNTKAETKAMEPYKDFIGPLREGTVAREVKSMYEFEDEIEAIVKEYYDLEAVFKSAPWTEPDAFKDFESRLSDLGKQWHDEVPFSELQNLLEDIKEIRGGF